MDKQFISLTILRRLCEFFYLLVFVSHRWCSGFIFGSDLRNYLWTAQGISEISSGLANVQVLYPMYFCFGLHSVWIFEEVTGDHKEGGLIFLIVTTDSVLHLSAWICVNQINMSQNWSRMGESLMGWAQALYAGSLAPYSYTSSIRSSPWAQNSKQQLSTISVVKDSNSQTKTNVESVTTNNLSSDHSSIGPLTQLVYFYEKGG